jgi:hypothetical protein
VFQQGGAIGAFRFQVTGSEGFLFGDVLPQADIVKHW